MVKRFIRGCEASLRRDPGLSPFRHCLVSGGGGPGAQLGLLQGQVALESAAAGLGALSMSLPPPSRSADKKRELGCKGRAQQTLGGQALTDWIQGI